MSSQEESNSCIDACTVFYCQNIISRRSNFFAESCAHYSLAFQVHVFMNLFACIKYLTKDPNILPETLDSNILIQICGTLHEFLAKTQASGMYEPYDIHTSA